MTQKVVCDGCPPGAKATDDWSMGKEAYFPGGARLYLRRNDGSEDGRSFDLCAECVEKIQQALPGLASITEDDL